MVGWCTVYKIFNRSNERWTPTTISTYSFTTSRIFHAHYLINSTQLQVRSVCMDPRLDNAEDVSKRKCSVLAGGGKFNIQGPPEGELFLVSSKREAVCMSVT